MGMRSLPVNCQSLNMQVELVCCQVTLVFALKRPFSGLLSPQFPPSMPLHIGIMMLPYIFEHHLVFI